MRGELHAGEAHPAAHEAMRWLRNHYPMPMLRESLASCAIEGNRLGEICCETIRRLDAGEPVSDRYLLGLCWMLREIEDASK